MIIFKELLTPAVGSQIFKLPVPVNIISMQIQDGNPCIWFVKQDGAKEIDVKITTRGTGIAYDNRAPMEIYIGSYVWGNGEFVGHVFAEAVSAPTVVTEDS